MASALKYTQTKFIITKESKQSIIVKKNTIMYIKHISNIKSGIERQNNTSFTW